MENQINDSTNPKLEQALYLLEKLEWSVIPVGRNKQPLIAWKRFQTSKPTREEVLGWFEKYPYVNVGVVTGDISGLVVVDLDPRHGATDEAFKDIQTVKVKTGGQGQHIYFKYEAGLENKAGVQPGVDIRAQGGFVVVPPSEHTSGRAYEWIHDPKDTPIAPLPAFVKKWIGSVPLAKQETANKKSVNGVPEGSRNTSAASLAGKLLARFPETEWETEVWPLLQGWNGKNTPPLPESELRTVFDSIKKEELTHSDDGLDKSLAAKLLDAITTEGIRFFHDQYQSGYAALKGDGREILKVRSRIFKHWIANYAWEKFEKIPSSETTTNVVQILEGKALFSSPLHQLTVRVTKDADSIIWYDLGNGKAVRIDTIGWQIIDEPPIMFRRFPHQVPQCLPRRDGSLNDLCLLVNLQSEEEKLLFQVITVAAFIPDFPHPLLVLYGPQGSGKTTPLRLLKSLIDPSVLQALGSSDSAREFVQLASHHWFLFLDNLSHITEWLSDSLARACTGDGFSKRELYSDDDDFVYVLQRPIALNGITLVVERADLFERSIILGLERIPKNKRRQEKAIWMDFELMKPGVLGAIFQAVSEALREYDHIELTSSPRMADFTKWGCAIAKALGYTKEEFLTAYDHNLSRQNDAAIEASNVGTAIEAFMADKEHWEGTPSELLKELEGQANALRIDQRSRDWPKDAARMTKKIQQVQTNLAEAGIRFIRDEKSRPRKITLQKTQETTDATDEASGGSQTDGQINPIAPNEDVDADRGSDVESGLSESLFDTTDASNGSSEGTPAP